MLKKIKSAILTILIMVGVAAVVYSILLVGTYVIDFGVLFTFLGGMVLIIVCSWELFSKKGFVLFRNKVIKRIIIFFLIVGVASFIFIESLLVVGGISDPVTKTDCDCTRHRTLRGSTITYFKGEDG